MMIDKNQVQSHSGNDSVNAGVQDPEERDERVKGVAHTERAAPRCAAPRLEQPEVWHTRRAQFILINYLKCVVTVVSW